MPPLSTIVPTLHLSVGVGVENLSPSKTARVENLQQNMNAIDMNSIDVENRGDFAVAAIVANILTVNNVKGYAESGIFTLKVGSESRKLFTVGCHLPPI